MSYGQGHRSVSQPSRQVVGFIPLDGIVEEPAPAPDQEELRVLREELFAQQQDFQRARRAFEQQAEAAAQRVADQRRRLAALRDRFVELLEACQSAGCRHEADLSSLREELSELI
jgi:hypothetical protein